MRPDLSFLRSFFLPAAFAAPASGSGHELGLAKDAHKRYLKNHEKSCLCIQICLKRSNFRSIEDFLRYKKRSDKIDVLLRFRGRKLICVG